MSVGFVGAIVLGGGIAKADFTLGEPNNLGPVINDAQDMQECDFSHDGLELYFSAYDRPGGYGRMDIWVSRRDTLDSPWQEPVNLGPNVNSAVGEIEPSISGDGLELYLGFGGEYTLRVCKRPSKDAPWGSPAKIGPPVGSLEDNLPVGSNDVYSSDISADGLSLYFASTRVGGYGDGDIWLTTRATKSNPWTEPVNLGPNVNAGSNDWSPSISTDGLTLVFHRGNSTWATTRRSKDDDWGPAVNLGIEQQGNNGWQHGAALSPDGSCLYLENYYSQWGGYGKGDLWKVEFTPIVDFNADGIVDSADMCIMVDRWGTDNSLCDIGPMPWGDGIVDVQDLKVLAEHLFEDYRLIAHWPLDEAQGDIAYDNASDRDGILIGDPLWQPDGGMVAGALQFDGIDDHVAIDPILNPGDGEFSVIAWVKGGAPGQVVLSQVLGANWLCADSVEGCLTTELRGSGRSSGGPLLSESNITDGTWHEIALVWDGPCRCLYVDGTEVARDAIALSGLEGADGGLNIGVGKDYLPGSYWSGLIDDIRIYNRAVKP